ncbi:PhoPQ-regulated protein [Salmonella enterica subsp. indica]|uniref:PhoPQ-regulated protein n=1 Tax=Salmonella enterica subsp. indica TaxID=59207 RepID=A0A379YMC9_SALER|nr:PhoPQ-regulated protein [Salmonella enterica subsp. indica]
MTLEDPLTYLNTDIGDRLKIDKYIINASGDDFYVPDNSHFYYDQLLGSKSLRVVPNSSHNGVLSVAEQSLITFVNRFQEKQKLPEITEKVQNSGGGEKRAGGKLLREASHRFTVDSHEPGCKGFSLCLRC